jgi:cell wall-associated NlpC family hydrolase
VLSRIKQRWPWIAGGVATTAIVIAATGVAAGGSDEEAERIEPAIAAWRWAPQTTPPPRAEPTAKPAKPKRAEPETPADPIAIEDIDDPPPVAPPAPSLDPGGDAAMVKADVVDEEGVALPPIEAPEAVRAIIEAGNQIARTPYLWGGGHGKWVDKGYDCSGSVSFALAAAGLLDGPLNSGALMSWGEPGPGKWVTIWTNPGHVFLEVAGIRFDTTARKETGSRWQKKMRSRAGYVARHPKGL